MAFRPAPSLWFEAPWYSVHGGDGVRPGLPVFRFACLCVWTTHILRFFPLTLPSLPPYNFFSSRDGGLSAYTAICAAVLPCVAGLKFHIYPVGNPTPVSITTASSVCAVGSWVVLRQSSCHTPFVIVALLLLNHSSS